MIENENINLCNIRKCNNCIKKLDGSCAGCSLCDVAFCSCSKEKLSRCLVRCPKKLGIFHNIKIVKDDRNLLENDYYKILISKIPLDIEIIISGISSVQRVREIKKISENRKVIIIY